MVSNKGGDKLRSLWMTNLFFKGGKRTHHHSGYVLLDNLLNLTSSFAKKDNKYTSHTAQ